MFFDIFDRSKKSVLESGMNHGINRCGGEVCGIERCLEKIGVDGEGEKFGRVGALLRSYDGVDGRIVCNVVYKKVSRRFFFSWLKEKTYNLESIDYRPR